VSVFADYARVYDLIYRDKDYAAEAAYAAARLRESSPRARRVLELGSGTGSHAIELGRMGFEITGVDLSPQMVERAELRRQALAPDVRDRLGFQTGNACTVRLGQQFDAVLSLFHVLSYQTGNDDVAAMFATAAAHLRPGSPFFFDFWYGPAVLSTKPEVRTKTLRDGPLAVVRVAEPTLRESENRVDVRYTVSIGGQASPLVETHAMRYFFLPELESALAQAGFELASVAEMGTGAPLGTQTWSGSALARKR
jgi:SAM-dependent methyltransferase